jgi:hypothetical protein
MPPISAASARLRPSATAASANSRRHCRVSRLSRAKARKSSALKSSRKAIAAAIGLVSFLAESMMTRNHKPPRAGNPLNESQATTDGISANLDAVEQLSDNAFDGLVTAAARYSDEIGKLEEAGVDVAFDTFAEAEAGFAAHVQERFASKLKKLRQIRQNPCPQAA